MRVSPEWNHQTDERSKGTNDMSQVVLNVPNISCGHCERTIVGALTPVAGISHVAVDIANRQVSVEFDESSVALAQIAEILAEEDYPVEPSADAGSAFAALPMASSGDESPSCACCAI